MANLSEVAAPSLPSDPADLFSFALDRLTWEHVRDCLIIDEPGRYWTIGVAGNLSLLVRGATAPYASLKDWTTREDSPGLFAAQDSAQLWHLGLMVEVTCSGTTLAHESMWSLTLDGRTHTTEIDSYKYFVAVIKQLTREACAYLPQAIDNRLTAFRSAASVVSGLDHAYEYAALS